MHLVIVDILDATGVEPDAIRFNTLRFFTLEEVLHPAGRPFAIFIVLAESSLLITHKEKPWSF